MKHKKGWKRYLDEGKGWRDTIAKEEGKEENTGQLAPAATTSKQTQDLPTTTQQPAPRHRCQ